MHITRDKLHIMRWKLHVAHYKFNTRSNDINVIYITRYKLNAQNTI